MAYVLNEDRRAQFVAATIKVIRSHGVSNATTRRIAEAAGAPLGSLHYCFKNKDELFEEVAKSFGTAGKSRFLNCVKEGMGVSAAASSILAVFAKWSPTTIKNCVSELEFHFSSLHSQRYKNIPRKIYTGWIQFHQELLQLGQRPGEEKFDLEAIARLIIAIQDGLVLQNQFLGKRNFVELVDMSARMLAEAIDRGDLNLPAEA